MIVLEEKQEPEGLERKFEHMEAFGSLQSWTFSVQAGLQQGYGMTGRRIRRDASLSTTSSLQVLRGGRNGDARRKRAQIYEGARRRPGWIGKMKRNRK